MTIEASAVKRIQRRAGRVNHRDRCERLRADPNLTCHPTIFQCTRWDSNPQAFRQRLLRPSRLPVPPRVRLTTHHISQAASAIIPSMRFLAIDPGDKRTGLALGDDITGIATPLEIIVTSNRPERLRQIARAVERHGPDALVLGLPLNMDGSEGPPAKEARLFALELERHFALTVQLADERLTSYAADGLMSRSGLTHRGKKERRDALAAATLLKDFLQARTKP